MMKQIVLNKVCFSYDTEWILEDLDLTIQQGDGCILLTGKNGAGKSTLLNVLCGFLSIDYLKQRMDQCSSGQQQKAGIACILLSNADVIIMDEPFVAIDAKSSECLCELIRRKCQDTVFLITSHTSAGMLPVVDRLLALDGRHLVLDTKDHRKIMQYFQPEEEAV